LRGLLNTIHETRIRADLLNTIHGTRIYADYSDFFRDADSRMRVSGILCVGHRMRRLYAPHTESAKAAAAVLAPIPAEILDQLVRDGPPTAEEIETASRRFKRR
jgi:hypothetical protein